jgi:hypothetical protein
VVLDKTISSARKTSLSVGQGTVLSPTLFAIFVNDITYLELTGNLYLFADDMSLVVCGKTYEELQQNANQDLLKITNWFTTNKLVPNYEKSNFILMGCPRSQTNINLVFNSTELQRVSETRILGVVFDHEMRFKTHIQNVTQKISNRLKMISRIRHFLPQNITEFIYKALVLPLFDYCDVIWGQTYPCHLKSLYLIQKRAVRVITFSNYSESSLDLFKAMNWMPFEKRIQFHSVLYIFKTIRKMNAEHNHQIFQFISESGNRFSKRNNDDLTLVVPKIKNNFLKNSIFYNGINLFNDLSYDLRNSSNFRSFKTNVLSIFN